MKEIDIIIPCYKAQRTILHTICSIYNQIIADKCKIVLINSSPDGDDYNFIIDAFSDKLDIREIPNKGERLRRGAALNYGMEITTLPYVYFIDADDSFYSDYSLYTLYKKIMSPNISVVSGNIIYEDVRSTKATDESVLYTNNKLFKRSFIENIAFHPTVEVEDLLFMDELIAKENKANKILQLNDVTYHYRSNCLSTVRSDGGLPYLKKKISELVIGMEHLLPKLTYRQQLSLLTRTTWMVYLTYVALIDLGEKCDDVCDYFNILKRYPELKPSELINDLCSNTKITDTENKYILKAPITFYNFLELFMGADA